MITIALPKGRLAKNTLSLLSKCGIIVKELDDRKLQLFDESETYRFLMVKPTDVPTYVDHGVADVGVVGKDTLMEANLPLYEMLDLKMGNCSMCICGFAGFQKGTTSTLKVATKYPRIAMNYYREQGIPVEIIKLNGSIELAPLLNLSHVIMDIVESGRTLQENGLCVLQKVCDLSARVCVNRVSLKTKAEEIKALLKAMEENIEGF